MAKEGASDVHLTAGFPPAIRIRGKIAPAGGYPVLGPQETRDTVYSILNDDQRKRFETEKQLDFAYAVPGVARFRVNCFFQRGSISAAFRMIPQEILTLASLGLPLVLEEFTRKPRGFVLVTGPTGSGKSTTLAAMIDIINRSARSTSSRSRTRSSSCTAQELHRQPARDRRRRRGLRAGAEGGAARGPRRDPGRRDARPGDDLDRADRRRDRPPGVRHPAHPVDRADRGPDHRRLPRPPAGSRSGCSSRSPSRGSSPSSCCPPPTARAGSCACEILVPTPAIRNLIREGKSHQIYSAIQTSGAIGMQTMDAHLAQLVRRGKITRSSPNSGPRCRRSSSACWAPLPGGAP